MYKSDTLYVKMRQRVLDIINPNIEYTQEDFEREFSNVLEPKYTALFAIKFTNTSTNSNPEYATIGSSGFDLRANLPNGSISLEHAEIRVVPTGLFFELPENFELQIRPRSGLAAKNGITVLNSPGTIDSDYRGEIKIILINHGSVFTIEHGDRIAQGIIASVINKNIINLEQISELAIKTERSSNGFGSTGLK